MVGWNEDDGLKWRPLPRFGIEIDHDLSAQLTPSAAARFADLFSRSGMLLARGQALSMDQQIAVMEMLGPVLRSTDGIGYISSESTYVGARAELTFHADYAFTPHPLDALSLHATEVVDGASSTRFANAERAFDRLPAELRARLDAHRVEMISPNFNAFSVRASEIPEPDAMLRAPRPSLLVNPRTGRTCLGVSEMHAARLLNMEWEASRELLREVYEILYAPDNVIEHVWERGDLLVWDNYTFQHARGSIESVGRRILQRVAVGTRSLFEMHPEMFATAAAS